MPRITNKLIEGLPIPAKGNKVHWDTETKGLGIRITSKGARAFVLRYVINGRERRYTIGEYAPAPGLNASVARTRANELKGLIAKNQDPLEMRVSLREAPTVKALCDDYLERHARPHKRPRSVSDDESMIENHIKPKLGALKVAAVGRRDIEAIHQSLKKHPYRANRVLALLSKMFSLAVEWEWIGRNPSKGVKRFPEEKRERWLTTEELSRLTDALKKSKNQRAANAIRLLTFTGARKGEVLKADWSQIDFERGVWTKPSAHTKQKRTEHVPLSAPALALLSEMQETALPGVPFIFPGDAPKKPLQDFKKEWKNIKSVATLMVWKDRLDGTDIVETLAKKLKRDPTIADIKAFAKKQGVELEGGLMDVRVHDLRHTYASHLVSSGVSLEIIGRLLGHTQTATTQRYAHLADDPLREATNRMGVIVESAEGKRKTAEVVSLHKGA